MLSADAPLGVALEAIAVTAQFQDGRLSGHSGCNRYTASYTLDGDSLSIGPDIGGTSMACPPAQMAVEQAYLGRLPQVTAFAIDGTTLTMTDDQDKTILRYVATEGSEAIQGDWEVTSYHMGTAIIGARRRHHDRQVRGRHQRATRAATASTARTRSTGRTSSSARWRRPWPPVRP